MWCIGTVKVYEAAKGTQNKGRTTNKAYTHENKTNKNKTKQKHTKKQKTRHTHTLDKYVQYVQY